MGTYYIYYSHGFHKNPILHGVIRFVPNLIKADINLVWLFGFWTNGESLYQLDPIWKSNYSVQHRYIKNAKLRSYTFLYFQLFHLVWGGTVSGRSSGGFWGLEPTLFRTINAFDPLETVATVFDLQVCKKLTALHFV